MLFRSSIRVQARSETLHTKPKDHEKYRVADVAIWDCCMYYKAKVESEVVLLTNDINLQIMCENEGTCATSLKHAAESHSR